MQTQRQNYFYIFFFHDTPLALNYRLTDKNFGERLGAKTRFRNNIEAIKLLRELDINNGAATTEQQDVLSRYAGWGGLAQAFDAQNASWANEYAELKGLLSSEEYRSANESVLSSFYTSKTVIDGIYDGLRRLGFSGGKILEPAMGIGNFIGLIPTDFDAQVIGVELDGITGKLAKHLYPQADVHIMGFEKTDFPDGSFDAVATNVPFGSFKVYDPDYEKHNLFIHDYFILKSLDKLRSGGIAAIVTSKGTMDKANTHARTLFAKRAELISAFRLPNTAFKDTANTEVTSDVLFFKKRDEINNNPNDRWIYTSEANGITLNNYFTEHPEMLLGRMVKGKSLYGGDDETTCESDGRDLTQAIKHAVKNLPCGVYEKASSQIKILEQQKPMTITDRQYSALMEIKETTRHILNIQVQNCSDAELASAQQRLNALYDAFKLRYGAINAKANRKLIRNDNDYTLLLSLENYDEKTEQANKSDIFSKRTIRKYVRPTKAETALEALHICKNETGKVDLSVICTLVGKGFDEVVAELDGHIYLNPKDYNPWNKNIGWETASEYLSGNVKQKLHLSESMAAQFPQFQKNVEALRKIQPAPLAAEEISVRIGAPWILPKFYKAFMVEKFRIPTYRAMDVSVTFNKFTGEWKVESDYRGFHVTDVYGTARMNGNRIFEYALNLQTPSVYDIVEVDGKERRVLNKPETIGAREKLRVLQEEFKAWIFDDLDRRTELVAIYNEKFNNLVLASFDGSYLTFPGMNPNIKLKRYQTDAVERIITAGNTLLHHVVGAGKTFEIAAAAMKLRQLKLAQKPMIVVPNHLTYQWASEFRMLYPNAKLLIATKKDFEKENRLKFVSRIATGEWDAIVIAMSSFEKLPISRERQERKIQEEIDVIEDAVIEMKKDRDKRTTVKDLQRILKNKRALLEALTSGKRDSLINFEELGVDYLFIDEAHKYKNKFIFTKMNNVAGISRAMSKRSSDLDMKIDYITELHGGQKGVVFATGTPISNSMVEMYTMQSYLAKQDLQDAQLMFFDSWAAVFGETVSALELAPSGQGYRTKTRFAKFVNLPEMLKMYRKFADVKTADMLNLPVPKANKRVITIKPTDEILRLNDIIADRAEKINAKAVKPEVDNMLKITSDGKKLALDPRCFDTASFDDDGLKVNICAENVFRIWNDTRESRRTQLVFCDLSTPKCAFKDYHPQTDFDVYNHVKYRLVNKGIPENEIAYIHDAENDVAKQILFDNVRSGKVRILIGSTEKCGAGTNVQNRLIAIHHLDTPYRPSDLEQREGRGIRQGNENAEIEIFTYVTERTFDAYSYQILENKQRFIAQINRGELTVREAQDIDETTFTYAEIKAITSANPDIKRKNEIELEINRLRVLQTQYRRSRYSLQESVKTDLPRLITRTENTVADCERDIELRNKNASPNFSISICGRRFTERKDASELYFKLTANAYAGKTIATFYGFEIVAEFTESLCEKYVTVKGNGVYRVPVSDSALGSLTRLENFFKGMESMLALAKKTLSERQAELASAKLELEKPFEYEQLILTLSTELAEIEARLDLDKAEIEPVIDDEKFQAETAKEEIEAEDLDDAV